MGWDGRPPVPTARFAGAVEKGSVSELSEAIQFCTMFLENPGVPVLEACVIDVGFIKGKGWAIIECNAAWSSGVYGCDGAGVLPVLRRACRPKALEQCRPIKI